MKRKASVLSCFLFLALSLPAEGSFGLGLVVGEPTGVSAAWKIGHGTRLQGTLAWDLTDPGGLTAAADYLFLMDDLLKIERTAIPLYAGFGAKLQVVSGSASDKSDGFPLSLVARFPFGARWPFSELPLEAFIELAPGLALLPETAFDIGGGIGLRWFFEPR